MFHQLGTLTYVTMSADASCRGLRSARDGPLRLEMTKGAPNSISRCQKRAVINVAFIDPPACTLRAHKRVMSNASKEFPFPEEHSDASLLNGGNQEKNVCHKMG